MPGSARAGSRQANAKACDMASKPINAGAANKSKAHDMTSKRSMQGRNQCVVGQQTRWLAQLAGFMGRSAEGVPGASSCRLYGPQC